MHNVLVKEVMAANPVFADPDDTLEDAAIEMKDIGCGILPVGNKNAVRGMISDRDIIIRAIAAGKDPAKEKVRDHMTAKAFFCKESDTVRQAAETMKQNRISRLIVKNDNDKVSGILSFGSLLRNSADAAMLGEIVSHASVRARDVA